MQILTLLVFVFCRHRFAYRSRATVSTVLRWVSVVLGVRPTCLVFGTSRCSRKTRKKKIQETYRKLEITEKYPRHFNAMDRRDKPIKY